jgi:hypothetical protein
MLPAKIPSCLKASLIVLVSTFSAVPANEPLIIFIFQIFHPIKALVVLVRVFEWKQTMKEKPAPSSTTGNNFLGATNG